MIARDMEAAGIPRQTAAGTVDFHATRHSYITLLSRSGVGPKMAEDLARHSNIALTMNHYTHLELFDKAAALEGLPSLLAHQTEAGARKLPKGGILGDKVAQRPGPMTMVCQRKKPLKTSDFAGFSGVSCQGGRRDSNPRLSEPQSDALTN